MKSVQSTQHIEAIYLRRKISGMAMDPIDGLCMAKSHHAQSKPKVLRMHTFFSLFLL